MDILGLDWPLVASNLVRLLIAGALALPIAWEREHSTRVMGLRTFPLVAVASCGYILIAEALFESDAGAQARILQGLITGIGFVGAGAILKQKEEAYVRGTATAASIWSTGAVGAAVGFYRYEIALIVSLLNFLVLQLLTPIKENLDTGEQQSPPD